MNAELASLAEAWIAYWNAPEDSPERDALWWAVDREYDLTLEDPEQLWNLILEVLRRDSAVHIQEVLSAGPLENLLATHGASVIGKIESEARANPLFARLLGGVWKNKMTDETWARVQAVWDRRGWDGIPETT